MYLRKHNFSKTPRALACIVKSINYPQKPNIKNFHCGFIRRRIENRQCTKIIIMWKQNKKLNDS